MTASASDTRTARARRIAARRSSNSAQTEAPQPTPPRTDDPTLTELGIPTKYHDELQSAGITSLSALESYGDLTQIKGIGPVAAQEIAESVTSYKRRQAQGN